MNTSILNGYVAYCRWSKESPSWYGLRFYDKAMKWKASVDKNLDNFQEYTSVMQINF